MNSNKNAIQVAIVDANEHLRYLSINQLENTGYIVQFHVSNGNEALSKINVGAELPDVCIVEDDFTAAKLLLEKYPELKVLMLGTDDCDKHVKDMLKIGVSGYVLKFAAPGEMITAVKALHESKKYFSVGISGVAMEYFK